jgi:hypothetical protein
VTSESSSGSVSIARIRGTGVGVRGHAGPGGRRLCGGLAPAPAPRRATPAPIPAATRRAGCCGCDGRRSSGRRPP